MLQAARELRDDNNIGVNYIFDTSVSSDGTWRKRGYASLNGVVTVVSIDTGKAIDYAMLTKKCPQCTVWEHRRGTEAFGEFMATQNVNCDINHVGSAGAMVSKGVVECLCHLLTNII